MPSELSLRPTGLSGRILTSKSFFTSPCLSSQLLWGKGVPDEVPGLSCVTPPSPAVPSASPLLQDPHLATSQQTTQPGLLFSCLKGSCSPGPYSLLVRKRQASAAPAASSPVPVPSPVPGMGLSQAILGWEQEARLKETKGPRGRRALTLICLAQDFFTIPLLETEPSPAPVQPSHLETQFLSALQGP